MYKLTKIIKNKFCIKLVFIATTIFSFVSSYQLQKKKSINIKYGPGWRDFIYNKRKPNPLIILIIQVCKFEENAPFLGFSCGKLPSSSRNTSVLRKDYFGNTEWARRLLSFYMLHSVPCTFYSHPLHTKLKNFSLIGLYLSCIPACQQRK